MKNKNSSVFLLLVSVLLVSTHYRFIVVVKAIKSKSPVTSKRTTKVPSFSSDTDNKLVIGIDGGTESIRACCFDAQTGRIVGKSHAVAYKTYHPQPGWAEQNPNDWYENLGEAVRGALASISSEDDTKDLVQDRICAICIDTTCCSVLALDKHYEPLRPSLLWMDARSASQTKKIMTQCKGDAALNVNCNGEGPISAEWMTPKALWIKEMERVDVWDKAHVICEYQDYINFKLTGVMCASSCNAAARWHWNGEECILGNEDENDDDPYRGRPMSLYEKLDMPELAEKLPKKCLPMGALVGELTQDAAKHLGLKKGIPIAQGGPDAFVGMIGLGCIHAGQLCLITGSSHLHCVVTAKPTTAAGSWGAYKGAPLPGINFAEGGQSSTGSIIRWAKTLFGSTESNNIEYETLDKEAASIPPGSDGLVALETFQGSRTPITDPLARGALVGLTLSHTRGHIWRALMEAVCFGTRACVDGLAKAGHDCNEIIIAGGTTRSDLWLQLHADITGKTVVCCENIDAPLLGCAILASVGAGVHETVEDAVNAMVRTSKRVYPRSQESAVYRKLYDDVYSKLSSSVQPVVHSISKLRGGGSSSSGGSTSASKVVKTPNTNSGKIQGEQRQQNHHQEEPQQGQLEISPSLLASDWANIESEIKRCLDANLKRLHIDVFDGVFLNSPHALTFGPQMVKAMRSVSTNDVILDIHLCVFQPSRFVGAMADAGCDRIIFQYEAMEDEDNQSSSVIKTRSTQYELALNLARSVIRNGMKCGISLNPETNVEDIFPLLETGLFDLVDVLAVEPGFGGQVFQKRVLQKIRMLNRWLEKRNQKTTIKIMVDGGINADTVKEVREAGADVVVAGTFLFRHPSSMKDGVRDLYS